jgi:hypothetical protein
MSWQHLGEKEKLLLQFQQSPTDKGSILNMIKMIRQVQF